MGFIAATLGANIGILGHYEMGDPRREVVRSMPDVYYLLIFCQEQAVLHQENEKK